LLAPSPLLPLDSLPCPNSDQHVCRQPVSSGAQHQAHLDRKISAAQKNSPPPQGPSSRESNREAIVGGGFRRRTDETATCRPHRCSSEDALVSHICISSTDGQHSRLFALPPAYTHPVPPSPVHESPLSHLSHHDTPLMNTPPSKNHIPRLARDECQPACHEIPFDNRNAFGKSRGCNNSTPRTDPLLFHFNIAAIVQHMRDFVAVTTPAEPSKAFSAYHTIQKRLFLAVGSNHFPTSMLIPLRMKPGREPGA
jgi:hypothetical protein